ncbi:glycosyltransferase [Candidatus Dependentiae bacterium]
MKTKSVIFLVFLITSQAFSKIMEFPKIKLLDEIPSVHSQRISSYPYISGDTFRSFCNFIIDKTNRFLDPYEIQDGDTVFIANHEVFLNFFFENIHPKINAYYILVTHNHDKSNFNAYLKHLDDDKIVAWFCVNSNLNHPKVFPIPIGIANQYWANRHPKHGNTKTIEEVISKLPLKKDIVLYANFKVKTNQNVRAPLAKMFSNKKFCYKSGIKDFKSYLVDLARSKFVLSPEGNGTDCHRTWEALLVGSIPIVSSSNLDTLFEDLPVIIVDDWNKVTEEFLDAKYAEMSNKDYNMEKIFADYWIEEINRFKEKAKDKRYILDNFPASFYESMSRSKRYQKDFANKDPNWQKLKQLFDEHIINNPIYSETPRIPKIIHQIWLGSNGKLPEKYWNFQKSWIDNHPDWEYMLWTEKEIDEFGLKNRKQYDATKNYGVKADIARYEILYKFGGLYIDTDFECLKPFDILHHICDFYSGSAYGNNAGIFNGLIGASPGHPILLECINNIQSTSKKREAYRDITSRTGPVYFTRCFFKSIYSHSGPSVILPVTYFYPWPHYFKDQNSQEQVKKWVNPESFAIHHWFVAWNK